MGVKYTGTNRIKKYWYYDIPVHGTQPKISQSNSDGNVAFTMTKYCIKSQKIHAFKRLG